MRHRHPITPVDTVVGHRFEVGLHHRHLAGEQVYHVLGLRLAVGPPVHQERTDLVDLTGDDRADTFFDNFLHCVGVLALYEFPPLPPLVKVLDDDEPYTAPAFPLEVLLGGGLPHNLMPQIEVAVHVGDVNADTHSPLLPVTPIM